MVMKRGHFFHHFYRHSASNWNLNHCVFVGVDIRQVFLFSGTFFCHKIHVVKIPWNFGTKKHFCYKYN